MECSTISYRFVVDMLRRQCYKFNMKSTIVVLSMFQCLPNKSFVYPSTDAGRVAARNKFVELAGTYGVVPDATSEFASVGDHDFMIIHPEIMMALHK